MKKILVLLAAVSCAAACSNRTANTATSADGKTIYYTADAANAKGGKYQIIDQEFDNMLAPESDYDSLSDYELQACGASYLPPAEKLKRPQAKVVAKQVANASASKEAASTKISKQKKVTNTTNIYYVDTAPNVPASTTTTTTTYASDGSVISKTTK